MKYFACFDDIIFDRNNINSSNHMLVFNTEGDYLFSCPKDTTDDQLKIMVRIANIAYTKGCEVGRTEVQKELQIILGLDRG